MTHRKYTIREKNTGTEDEARKSNTSFANGKLAFVTSSTWWTDLFINKNAFLRFIVWPLMMIPFGLHLQHHYMCFDDVNMPDCLADSIASHPIWMDGIKMLKHVLAIVWALLREFVNKNITYYFVRHTIESFHFTFISYYFCHHKAY